MRGFQRGTVHLCSLRGCVNRGCQTLRMLRFNQNVASNPKCLARRVLAGRLQRENATVIVIKDYKTDIGPHSVSFVRPR